MNQVSAPANGRRSESYPPDDAAASRHDELTAAAAQVRVRRTTIPVEMVLLIAACVLFPAGIVLILLGWDGASHTGHLYEQVDYLISGGLLGVALAAAGGFMYFGYWLSRQLNESRRQNALTLQYIRRLEQAMTGGGYSSPVVAPAPTAGPPSNGESGPRGGRGGRRSRASAANADDPTGEIPVPMLVATPRGSLLHRPDCPVVVGRAGVQYLPADTDGYGYCTMCDAAGAAGATTARRGPKEDR